MFTDSEGEENGNLVRRLAAEIRSKKFYVPELDLIMVNEHDGIIGMCIFSRFRLEGRYEEKLLILTPVAVKTELQRQHRSKVLIEYALAREKELGYRACIVEGICGTLDYRYYET